MAGAGVHLRLLDMVARVSECEVGVATALHLAGFPDDEVLVVVAILDSFALGFGLDLASPDEIWQPQGPTETLGRLLANAQRGPARSDRAFEEGFELLLDSLRLRLARLRDD